MIYEIQPPARCHGPVVQTPFQPRSAALITHRKSSPFTCGDEFSRVKAEACHIGDIATSHSANGAAKGAGGILDQGNAVFSAKLSNLREAGGVPKSVDKDHRFGTR